MLILRLIWRNYRLRAIIYLTLWPKMLFFESFYYTFSLFLWHIVEAIIFLYFKRSAMIFIWLTFLQLITRKIYIRSCLLSLLNFLYFLIFNWSINRWSYSINTLFLVIFIWIYIYNIFLWMINCEISNSSILMILIQIYLLIP